MFECKKYTPTYKDQVLDLLKHLWSWSKEERNSYFKWKYEENPYTNTPLAFIVLDKDKVIAFRGYMTQPLEYKNELFLNASLADTVTDPLYRRKGLFAMITAYSIKELSKDSTYKVSLNSSSGGSTLMGYVKLGWCPLAERKHYFSFSLNAFIPKKVEIPKRVEISTNKFIIISTDAKIEEMASLSNDQKELDMISINKSNEYLEWRLSNPLGNYIFAYYYINNKLSAYISLKETSQRKLDLIDYEYINKKEAKRLFKVTHKVLTPLYITQWTVNFNDSIVKHSFYLGFISLNPILKWIDKFKNPPFLIRLTQEEQEEKKWLIDAELDMRKRQSWNLRKIIGDEI